MAQVFLRRSLPLTLLAAALTACTVVTADGGAATLSWSAPKYNADGSMVNDLAGYYISYGTSPTAMTRTIKVPTPTVTSYVFKKLSPGTYYFSVAAYTSAGITGRSTATVSKTVR